MHPRKITPSQLALFSRSPVIGAWWEELRSQGLFKDKCPENTELDKQLFLDGLRHEEVLIKKLKKQGFRIAKLEGKQNEDSYEATLGAMSDGYDFIWQASLTNMEMRGSADLLKKINGSSPFGNWSYQPIECKLSSKTKTTFLVQACAYCDLLSTILQQRPQYFELYLGGGKFKEFKTDNFWYWYKLLRKRYKDFQNSFNPNEVPIDSPGDHGSWTPFIQERLEASRDLIMVAKMRQTQRLKLKESKIHTIDELAALKDGTKVKGLRQNTLNDLRDQAKLQVKPKGPDGKPNYILKKIAKEKGLSILPKQNQGDIWFDLEGVQDPVLGIQLEYLIGLCYKDESDINVLYKAWWAHSPSEEKRAFKEWVEWIENRLKKYPHLKIYHYGSYEKSAIRRLAQQHSTKEIIIDKWLRSSLLVDLLPIVTSSIILGEDSYSIKKVEKLYMDKRDADVKTAGDSVVAYRNWSDSGEPKNPGILPNGSPRLKIIEDYNREDCESTQLLHDWLLNLKKTKNFPDHSIETLLNQETIEIINPLENLSHKLLSEIPEECKTSISSQLSNKSIQINQLSHRGVTWRAQLLLAHLLPFHHREAKVSWWTYFDRKEIAIINSDDLFEDSEVIEGAVWQKYESRKSKRTGADFHLFKFNPSQDLKLNGSQDGSYRITFEVASTGLKIDAVELDDDQGLVTLKYPWKKKEKILKEYSSDGIPKGECTLIKVPSDISKPLRDRLEKKADSWINGNKKLPKAIHQLLELRPVKGLIELNKNIQENPKFLPKLLANFFEVELDIVIALQGPPGTGKSSVTARLISELIKLDKKIAISSNSNQAINNLLLKVKDICEKENLNNEIVKATNRKEDQKLNNNGIDLRPSSSLTSDETVVGGTTWVFSRDELKNVFDVLVIDEAGQMSLANLLVMSECAKSILLVGDQQQLSQPNKADHPGDSGKSCLEYLMQGESVVPEDKGIFLNTSWRMEPSITNIVSELFYDKRLMSNPSNQNNSISWGKPFLKASGNIFPNQGLVFEAIEHFGCSVKSDKEIDFIEKLIESLLGGSYTYWQFNKKCTGEITPNDILVTAPYNLQVNRLNQRLKGRAKVGTVDRFQGQEAPIAIHSLTASSSDDAPRGIEFLLEPNRLNVAISRAQCLSIIIGSPRLATGLINTVDEAEKVNRLCRLMMIN